MDAPRQSNLHLYIKEMKRHAVTDVVRGCEECTYSGDVDLAKAGIQLHDMAYDDGTSPPKHVISTWLELVRSRFFAPGKAGESRWPRTKKSHDDKQQISPWSLAETAPDDCTIAVHCVAGLGRAPVLVAIALIEFANYDPGEAVALIRKHRRGAINDKQLHYLEQYQRVSAAECACTIM